MELVRLWVDAVHRFPIVERLKIQETAHMRDKKVWLELVQIRSTAARSQHAVAGRCTQTYRKSVEVWSLGRQRSNGQVTARSAVHLKNRLDKEPSLFSSM